MQKEVRTESFTTPILQANPAAVAEYDITPLILWRVLSVSQGFGRALDSKMVKICGKSSSPCELYILQEGVLLCVEPDDIANHYALWGCQGTGAAFRVLLTREGGTENTFTPDGYSIYRAGMNKLGSVKSPYL